MVNHRGFILATAIFTAAICCAQATEDRAETSATPTLDADSRYQAVTAQAGDGSGSDAGAFLPPLASTGGAVTGTVRPDSGTGATGFYLGKVDAQGKASFVRGITDANGHFDFRVPAGIVALILFKHFDKHGAPDQGATCSIGSPKTHISDLKPVVNVPARGPALIEANTAYERDGFGKGVFFLHTRDVNPLNSHVLVDGRSDSTDVLAASSDSMVGQFHDDVPLGRHTIGVSSDGRATNEQEMDLLTFAFRPIGSLKPGQVQEVVLDIQGLHGDPAVVDFTVSGAAKVAGGGDHRRVPVVSDTATCLVQADTPGPFVVNVTVRVEHLLAENNPGPGAGPGGGSPGNAGPGGPAALASPSPAGVPEEASPSPKPPVAAPSPYLPPCTYKIVQGAFEPTQGVWQDDYEFDDHGQNHGNSGKQIVFDPTARSPMWDAQIPMVAGRDTLLFGLAKVRHVWAFPPVTENPGDRDWITMKIDTNCEKNKLVRLAFVLKQPGEPDVPIGSSKEKFSIPLLPPAGSMQTVYVRLYVHEGFPEDHRFTFKPVNTYVITGSLVDADDGSQTGLEMSVRGTVNTTSVPLLTFRPLILSKGDPVELASKAKKLAYWTSQMIGDYYPIVPLTVKTELKTTEDLTAENLAKPYVSPYTEPRTKTQRQIDDIKTGITAFENWEKLRDRLGAGAFVAGAGRIIVVLNDHDYDLVDPARLLFQQSRGMAVAPKVIIVRESVEYKTVMHELAHTLPYLWSTDEMRAECWLPGDYHNQGGKWAFGERLYVQGAPLRFRVEDYIPFMTNTDNPSTYIAQCTYWNLVNQLARNNDPPVTLVRGYVAHSGAKVSGSFSPFYDEGGVADVAAGKPGVWNIIVRSAGSSPVTYPIRSPFTLNEDERTMPSGTFAYRIPTPPTGATIELKGPGIDLSRTRGLQAPEVVVSIPAAGALVFPHNGKVEITWSARAAAGTKPVATVLYAGGGGTLTEQAFETTSTSWSVTLDPSAHQHHVRVVISDGSRSAQADVEFSTR
jgi:hypothetical protein